MKTLELILDKKKFFFHELGGLYLDELEKIEDLKKKQSEIMDNIKKMNGIEICHHVTGKVWKAA